MLSIDANATGRKPLGADEPAGRLLPAKMVHQEFGFGRRTLGRHIKENTEFPKPVRINGRLYFREVEIETYKRDLIRRASAGA
jgi:predicted DNA-binding transcriptional regulator AlpA